MEKKLINHYLILNVTRTNAQRNIYNSKNQKEQILQLVTRQTPKKAATKLRHTTHVSVKSRNIFQLNQIGPTILLLLYT